MVGRYQLIRYHLERRSIFSRRAASLVSLYRIIYLMPRNLFGLVRRDLWGNWYVGGGRPGAVPPAAAQLLWGGL